MREPGFYWVRESDEWTVAQWSGKYWYVVGWDISCRDSDFAEIDPRRIVREG